MVGNGQHLPPMEMKLQPFRMVGHDHSFRRNLSFAGYKTEGMRRTLGSYFSFGNFSPFNELTLFDVPIYKKDISRSKDVFRFELTKNDSLVSVTECRATLYQNETFRLFKRKQDSSFFGARNKDVLTARIKLGNDTNNIWEVLATNLNGTKDEDQKGIIRKGIDEITFVKTTLLLKEKVGAENSYENLFATAYEVYSFSRNKKIIGAVSFREKDRKIWFYDGLEKDIKDVVASVASILTLRREIY